MNLKSKTCGELPRTIQNAKWLGLSVIAFVLVAAGTVAQAHEQAGKIPRIGFESGSSGDLKHPSARLEAFRKALLELGYVEGQNIAIEYRSGVGRAQLTELANELVRLKVDVLVVRAQPAIRAAKQATKTIPIVMVTTQDPVALGFINSLARPGGNITGITTLQRELSGKRLELLKEVLPELSRVAALANATSNDFKMYEAPARTLKLQLQLVRVQGPNPDFDEAFQTMAKGHANAVIAVTNSMLNRHAKRIADLAIKNRLPLLGERSDYVEAGGLMSYSADDAASYRRAAVYVDKILKGTKPADLPVEQPTEFELVINLKTAKRIGVTIPDTVLYRATNIIK